MDPRQQIRQSLRTRRDAQTVAACQHVSLQICEQLIRSTPFRDAQRIAGYFPHGKEVDLTRVMQTAWSWNKQVFLPVLASFPRGHLSWLPYAADTPLYQNRFGIPEPRHTRREHVMKLRSLDLILMPLVGFDAQGNRIGMGGGFYDRSLAQLAHTRTRWHRPLRIGVAFSWQEVSDIPVQEWDIPLDGVVTEHGIRIFGSR